MQSAHPELRHPTITILHLLHCPLERLNGFFRLGDDRRKQVWNSVVECELEHFRVDQNQSAHARRQTKKQRQKHRIDRNRLARARRAGNQKVRHIRKICISGFPVDALPQRQQQRLGVFGFGVLLLHELQKLTQEDRFSGLIGQLDSDGVFSRNHRDARCFLAHGARNVVGERYDSGSLDARSGLQCVPRDDRTRLDVFDGPADAEIRERVFE